MEYGAIDLHKKESQIRILMEGGEIIDRRIATTRDRLTAVFWGRPRMRILLEAATESEWVAQHLETLGHEVIVADPNFTAMYGHRSRRIKTDRRDVAALADACQRGHVSRRASAIGRAAHGAVPAEHSSRTDGRSDARHFTRPRHHPRSRISHSEWRHAHLPAAESPNSTCPRRSPRRCRHCDVSSRCWTRSSPRRMRRLPQRGRRRPRRPPPDDAAGHRSDYRQRVCRRAG